MFLFVCKKDHAKTTSLIFMKLGTTCEKAFGLGGGLRFLSALLVHTYSLLLLVPLIAELKEFKND